MGFERHSFVPIWGERGRGGSEHLSNLSVFTYSGEVGVGGGGGLTYSLQSFSSTFGKGFSVLGDLAHGGLHCIPLVLKK